MKYMNNMLTTTYDQTQPTGISASNHQRYVPPGEKEDFHAPMFVIVLTAECLPIMRLVGCGNVS